MNRLFKLSVLGILGILAVPAWADNAVEMVTYFPVPYAAYNNVFVSQKFDVGTSKSPFTLELGSAASNPSLKAGDVYLRKIGDPSSSALGFSTDIYTPEATFGTVSLTGPITMRFENLRINTLNNNSAYAVEDVSAKDWTVHGNMYMAEDSFETTNDAAKLPQCENTVRWKQLEIGGKQGYYLVCEDGTNVSPSADLVWIDTSWTREPGPGGMGCTQVNFNETCPNDVWGSLDNYLFYWGEGYQHALQLGSVATCTNKGATCVALAEAWGGDCQQSARVTFTCSERPN